MIPLGQARSQLTESFAALKHAAESLEAAGVITAARAEEERLAGTRFVIVLVGERGTGKSTLANALLGKPYLPARPIPTTAVVHEIEHAEVVSAVVRNQDGTEAPIAVAELGNLSEGAGAAADRASRVIVRAPAELLRGGVSLLDTPGTNDLSLLGAEVTYGVLPEADAVVIVLDATQPLRRTEREFLEHRLPFAARERTVAVLNRADLLGVGELAEAESYTKRQLEKSLDGTPLFAASGKEALERPGGDKGFEALRKYVLDLLGKDRQRLALVRSAGEGLRLGEALRDHLRLRREAASLAEGELEARLLRMQRAAGGTRQLAHTACGRVDARAAEIAAEAEGRLHDFTEKFKAALPQQIESADEGELRKYLPFFLEETLRKFAEAEVERVEQAMSVLAYEVLSELARKDEGEEKGFELGPTAPVNVEVDTAKFDVGVVAAGALGTMFLFTSPLLGILLLAGAPILHHVLKGRVAGRVRDAAKEQALKAVEEARSRLAAKLREEILGAASRLREGVLQHGEASAKDAELALSQVLLAKKQGGATPEALAKLQSADADVEGALRDLGHLAEALANQA